HASPTKNTQQLHQKKPANLYIVAPTDAVPKARHTSRRSVSNVFALLIYRCSASTRWFRFCSSCLCVRTPALWSIEIWMRIGMRVIRPLAKEGVVCCGRPYTGM
ncbi:unnamed protein product, partial [Tuber aestivum]